MQQQGGDYSTSYYYHQNPNELLPAPPHAIASAPPFSDYSSPDFPSVSSSHPPYFQNPDTVPNPFNSQSPCPAFPSATTAASEHPPSVSYYPYDRYPTATNYSPIANPNLHPNPSTRFSTPYTSSSVPSVYEDPYHNSSRGDGKNSVGYSYGRSDDHTGPQHEALEEGVYAYDGGSVEPYGARGTAGVKPSSLSYLFDDYGRNISFGKDQVGSGSGKIVSAVPKVEGNQDGNDGVQKFRVKLLPEGAGQSAMDVLCQVGLDGIRMLDPSTNRTLRIYQLETVTRWEVTESSIYTFWAKSNVDIEPRRIRLQSNSYTTNTIFDTVTAATVQLKEMGGKDSIARFKGSDADKLSEQPAEKKKGFADWMNLIKQENEEKDHWVPDEAVTKCTACGTDFGAFVRKHHCRNCGDIFCDKCTQGRVALTAEEHVQPVRVCDGCLAEVSQRLGNAKEATSKSAIIQSHGDLARRLQEEMDRNRKASSVSKSSDASGGQMKEVACPTCTVHLQVQVPTSGSEMLECGVCQHQFLVSAH